MTTQMTAPTWSEAFAIACDEMAKDMYAGWGYASVFKCTPDSCGSDDCDGAWVASIA